MRKLLIGVLVIFCFLITACGEKKINSGTVAVSSEDLTKNNSSTDVGFVPDKNITTMTDSFKNFGVTANINNNNIVIYVDSTIYAINAPKLQKIGIVNPKLSAFQINNASVLLSCYFGQWSSIWFITNTFYQNPDIRNLSVSVYVNSPDIEGNMASHLAVSFEISRKKSNEINWSNFDYLNLPKVTKDFYITPWFIRKYNELLPTLSA